MLSYSTNSEQDHADTLLNFKSDRSHLRMLQPPAGAQLDWLLVRLLSTAANVERSLRISCVPQRGQVTGGCSARRGTSCSNRSSQRWQRYS